LSSGFHVLQFGQSILPISSSSACDVTTS
jgi:hypothetical protein